MAQLLRRGSRSPEVEKLQGLLNQLFPLDFPQLVEDGLFGTKTHEWVAKFQKGNGLVHDGIVGPKTRSKLKEKLPMTLADPLADGQPATEKPLPIGQPLASVYWCALPTRILRIGDTSYFNHSCLAIVTPENHSFALSTRDLKRAGRYKFITLSITGADMKLHPNDRLDSKAVDSWLALRNTMTAMQFQANEVLPPGISGVAFANRILQLARNYTMGKGPAKFHWGPTLNCNAIVNSLLSAAGVSASERSRCGDFVGFDAGNDTVVDPSYFR